MGNIKMEKPCPESSQTSLPESRKFSTKGTNSIEIQFVVQTETHQAAMFFLDDAKLGLIGI
jgi:hypothetical protein